MANVRTWKYSKLRELEARLDRLEGVAAIDKLNLNPMCRLSAKERECIVRWVESDMQRKLVVADMGISQHTFDTYMDRAMRKLGLTCRQKLVRAALRHGLIDIETWLKG
jgi:DNA-binding CsgD family transcriptional regulator